MKVIKHEYRLCYSCMEEHDVQIVRLQNEEEFNKEVVSYTAEYEYCTNTDMLLATDEMLRSNGLAMKDAYRTKVNLLTSKEIIAIRRKYTVSQKDFSLILGWGRSTIGRYESHQVQDRVHNDVLDKIDRDPKWFLEMLDRSKDLISEKAYRKYHQAGLEVYARSQNIYLVDYINAMYADYQDAIITGNSALDLEKIVDVISYYALNIKDLHKVKCMKMLWYADYLSYKRRQHSITGLVYCSWPMGAVPIGHEHILSLQGILFDHVETDGRMSYRFLPQDEFAKDQLTEEDRNILDVVIAAIGHMEAKDIISIMHDEVAFKETKDDEIISYEYAEQLSLK